MTRSIRQQIANGLRLGSGLGLFLIGAMLIGLGFRGVGLLAPVRSIIWSNWLGWIELIVGAVTLVMSAQIWYQLLAGCMLCGFVKCLTIMVTGKDMFPPHRSFTLAESVGIALFCLVSLLLMARFAKNPPNSLDSVSLTVWVLCLWPATNNGSSLWWAVGLFALCISWGFSHWCSAQRRKRSGRVPHPSRSC